MIEIDRTLLNAAIGRAISDYMAELAPGLARLYWQLKGTDSGGTQMSGLANDPEAMAAWVTELGLSQVEHVTAGVTAYAGECTARDIERIEVWCITDLAAFDRQVEETRAAVMARKKARLARENASTGAGAEQ
ncbi:hypothetical protein [Nocardia brasiliensis]|uniref:hypothetical protein n=1 Tax=Nocardia brasiliensis TaxID=37326 RepID=UPI002454618C|nr:hypothetical protein [Nocardia brasiliensis]